MRKILCYLCFSGLFVGQVAGGTGEVCLAKPPLVQDIQKITCATQDLRVAVGRYEILQKVRDINFFGEIHPKDVVRSQESLSIFNQALTERIEETHKQYQDTGKDRYTLSVTSYPAEVKSNTCKNQKTIQKEGEGKGEPQKENNLGFLEEDEEEDEDEDLDEEDLLQPVADYKVIPGKSPRSFEMRKHKGKFMLCEQTSLDDQARLTQFCDPELKCQSDKKRGCPSKYKDCKKHLTPSCKALDKAGALSPGPSNCIGLKDFGDLSKKLLMSNVALEWKYCPGDCSYYTQTVQALYKSQEKTQKNYCSDNYLIVHCGPKKKGGQYNLNIREINDLCRDFETCLSL